jgi:hypothetical protein
MNPIATYSFLPWLRNGVANTIASADGDVSVNLRAKIHVDLALSGDPVGGGAELVQHIGQDVALYGPGDIIGIDSRAVVRTDPRNWITNYESNYLAAIEFYDQDFLWRYTPAAPDTPDSVGGGNLHLRPWIALIVLKESEFSEGQNLAGHPLPWITIADTSVFPPAAELWAWAHVHFNQSLSAGPAELVSTDVAAVVARTQAAVTNPDVAYSRLLSPRRLEPNTSYHAFVMPVFETGRLAGLGYDPSGTPYATFSAWAQYPNQLDPTSYPFYYRWYFSTGTLGDFEYLVNLLKPQPVDPRVGTRDMDVQTPGWIAGISDAALGGVLRLGGALRVPDKDLTPEQLADRQKYENWDQNPYPHPFEKNLAAFINLADDYAVADAGTANMDTGIGSGVSDDPDPLITPPLYGRWHALTNRLLVDRSGNALPNTTNWVHRLNLDPGYRVPGGFGAQVVESNAESYMNAAWEQIGDVLSANQRIRRLHFATAVSSRWYDEHFKPLAAADAQRALMVGAPVASRVLVGGRTITWTQSGSLLGSAMTSTALRRVIRPQSRLMRSLAFTANATPTNLLERVNSGAVSAAPPKAVPTGVATIDQVASATAAASGVPGWLNSLLTRFPWIPVAVLVAAAVIAVLLVVLLAVLVPGIGWLSALLLLVLALLLVAGGVGAYLQLRRWSAVAAVTTILQPQDQTPAAVNSLPKSPDFVLSAPGSSFQPHLGVTDSIMATRFKTGLRDSFNLLQTSAVVGARPPLSAVDLSGSLTATVGALDPRTAILARGFATIDLPDWVRTQLQDQYAEVMAYPKIDLPMYQPLKAISIELFLPNINLIAPNSITLIETNRKFLEAYMVGLNHEFARKLLWREYPTDQRGSYFRQFWDPAPYLNSQNLDPQALKEKQYDIAPLHTWPPASTLGTHLNRPVTSDTGEDAVLVIRGELLKKYPTAVIYAHKAQWETNADGSIDPTQPRRLADLTDAEQQSPPPTKVRTPLYEAKADPDIYFFGFDLTIEEAMGDPGTRPGDDPGWFFVIKERPGEPRFGLELTRTGDPEIFGELTWADALPSPTGQFVPAGSLANVSLAPVSQPDDEGKQPQHDEDTQVNAATVSSARWAYLLLRAPVMVAVHAAQMLGTGGSA